MHPTGTLTKNVLEKGKSESYRYLVTRDGISVAPSLLVTISSCQKENKLRITSIIEISKC